MITQLAAIARIALVESLRQPIVFVLVLVCGVLQVLNTWSTGFSMGMESSGEVTGDNKLLLDVGLATVFVCGMLLAAFVATAVVSREIENKTVLTVVSKPINRPLLLVGKYIGVAGAILVSVIVMLTFLLFAIRHGVMSTASDELDGPVLLFSLSAVGLAFVVGGWCNYFYGWNFPQTFILLLLPLIVLGYIVTLFLGKEWEVQDFHTDFKPQILLACCCLTMAILVMTAVATAASTRLGQVSTIVVCFAFFLASLLSNYFIGRHVFSNEAIGQIQSVRPDDASKPNLLSGETVHLSLQLPPTRTPEIGRPLFFSPNPNGFPMLGANTQTSREAWPVGDFQSAMQMPPGIVVTGASGLDITVRNLGTPPAKLSRPPEADDYVFLRPTTMNAGAMALWGAIPNMQYFWVLDAITQARRIPPTYVGTAAVYAVVQIIAALSFGVLLFQRRDVG